MRDLIEATPPFHGSAGAAAARPVFIVGGGQLSIHVAQTARTPGRAREAVRARPGACGAGRRLLNDTTVINADGTDQATLEEAGVARPAFLALTKDDENNIIASLLARRLGVGKVVALINQLNYLSMVQRLGVNTTVSPRLTTVDRILQFVRRGRVLSVTTFRDEEAEAIELLALPESR